MTQLLQRAISELSKLPDDTQDALATRILADLEDDQAWDEQFAATTEEQWARLSEMAQREIAAGDSLPLEEFLRIRKSGE
ncbi:MAG TPA: hypothetical protein VLV54_02920 [Thermoanaerobaculia bacterium]|nr:hypothetical protein [Thermoanaerobaculia bacterium]